MGKNGGFLETEILLSDNRIDEYELHNFNEIIPESKIQEHKYRFEKPSLSNRLETTVNPKTIELSSKVIKIIDRLKIKRQIAIQC